MGPMLALCQGISLRNGRKVSPLNFGSKMAKLIGHSAMLTTHWQNFDGAGVHGVKPCEVLKNWEIKQYCMLTNWDDTAQTVANQKLRKHPCETPCTLRLDTSPWSGMSCERCVIYPQHLWVVWGFKVQSGFKTNEARRDSTKNAEVEWCGLMWIC